MPTSKVRRKSQPRRRPRRVPSALGDATLPEISFPTDLLGLDGPEQTEIGLDIVFALPEPHARYRLPVRLVRRIIAGSRVELWGTALQGTFDVHLIGNSDHRWQLKTQVADTELNGTQMLKILELFDAATHATGVGLARTNGTPTALSEMSPEGLLAPPEGLRRVVEAHAEIERRLQISVPAPTNYTPAEVQDTLETAALLRGETVVQTWEERRWEMSEEEAHSLLAGAFADKTASMLMEQEDQWHWKVGKQEVPVGTVALAYPAVRMAEVIPAAKAGRTHKSSHSTTFILSPGDDNTVLFRLVDVAPVSVDAPDQRWFWDPSWQGREAEVDKLVANGQVVVHDDASAFLAHLDAVSERPS